MPERGEPGSLPLPPRDQADASDPVPRLLETLERSGRARTQNLKGAARGYVLARLARELKAPLICVTADDEAADHLASDLAFFLGGKGSPDGPAVVRMPADEVLPYDEVSPDPTRSEEHTSELQSLAYLVCRLLLEKKKNKK